MYERFTRDARRVLVLAQEDVRSLGHDAVGTEHLLLAVCRVDAWVSDLLAGLGIRHDRLTNELIPGLGTPTEGAPLDADAKAALLEATRQADAQQQTGVAAEHILLGVLEVGGTAAACLHELGHTTLDVRRALLSVGVGRMEPEEVEAPLFPVAPPIAQPEGDGPGEWAGGFEPAQPQCPGCRLPLTDAVRHVRVPVDIEVTVDLVYCGRCGHTLTTRVVERG